MERGRTNYGSMSAEYRDDPYRDPDKYDAELNKIRGKVSGIKSSTTQLEELFRKMSNGGDTTSGVRSQILTLETNINQMIDSTNLLLRNLRNYRVEERTFKKKTDGIKRDLDAVLSKYRDLTKSISAEMRSLNDGTMEEGVLVDTGDTRNLLPARDKRNMEADLALQLAQEQEMQRLADDIVTIEDTFRDFHGQVMDQSESVDSIYNHIDESRANVEEANQQLSAAVVHKRKVRKRCICLVIIVLVILGIIGLIIGIEVKR